MDTIYASPNHAAVWIYENRTAFALERGTVVRARYDDDNSTKPLTMGVVAADAHRYDLRFGYDGGVLEAETEREGNVVIVRGHFFRYGNKGLFHGTWTEAGNIYEFYCPMQEVALV